MYAIGEPVRVIARGNALPTSAVGKVVTIAEVDTSGAEPVYGFRYACRMVWGKAGQFEAVSRPDWLVWQEQVVNAVLASDPIPFPLPLSG